MSQVRLLKKFSKKLAFARFVKTKEIDPSKNGEVAWMCCGEIFQKQLDIYIHCSKYHLQELDLIIEESIGTEKSKLKPSDVKYSLENDRRLTTDFESGFVPNENSEEEIELYSVKISENLDRPWLPKYKQIASSRNGQVLLYYRYRNISRPQHVAEWQKELCNRLGLTGKIRVASEGINGTVSGIKENTEKYMEAFINHPLFNDMLVQDFKTSNGSPEEFLCGLVVGVHSEIVPMGISPDEISHANGGIHLSPKEFHDALSMEKNNAVLVDCRNFYESKIGSFRGALKPDIRKFSYWPEYIDKNLDRFRDKKVLMFCTGGIRCERGSAYLKSKGVCKEVYQLSGGIHRYIEEFPDGHYRGKLFVFDDRMTISSNVDIVSNCFYCDRPWDQYKSCSSKHCHILVLICDSCRGKGKTACCDVCQENYENSSTREQCGCTDGRSRIPNEKVS